MKLFLISQTENNDYYTIDSAVVCAPDEDAARLLDPVGTEGKLYDFGRKSKYSSWCSTADKVTVKLLGDAAPGVPIGVVRHRAFVRPNAN
jgi:hypothetical protein